MKSFLRSFWILSLGLQACTSRDPAPAPSGALAPVVLEGQALIDKGHKVYIANCLSCHGPDPRVDGPVGPSLAGSSLELLKARVLYLKYPEGYKPKRDSGSMVALPHLEPDLPALAAYLNSLAH